MLFFEKNPFLKQIFIYNSLKTLILSLFIIWGSVGLGPDEAQYFAWSQHLDIGYYSKPPAISWIIFLGTSLFGKTEFGVRFPSLLLGFCLPFIVFRLSNRAGFEDKVSYLASLIMMLTPFGIAASFLAITDVGMIFFFTLALIPLIEALHKNETPNYLKIGFLIALGAQFKWTIYFFWPIALLLLFSHPNFRHNFLKGFCLSLVGLIPSFTWNFIHNFPTLKHVGQQVINFNDGEKVLYYKGNALEFIGSQAALFSPVFFGLLLLAMFSYFRKKENLPEEKKFFLIITILFYGGFLLASFFKKIQGNWIDIVYPIAVISIALLIQERRSYKLFKVGLLSSISLTALVFAIPTLQENNTLNLPFSVNVFRQNVGLKNLKTALTESGYKPQDHFLVSHKYQTSSQLHFYAPEQKRPYFLNLDNLRYNQFSFWPSLKEEQLHKNGFFILIENEKAAPQVMNEISTKKEQLLPFFKSVIYQGCKTLFSCEGKDVKRMHLFFLEDYTGKEPKDADKY
ncbi:ArnT family glycosyltransferase [Criblamydia sequanensis]|uniref:Conserved putative membrane protein n=1 Tax=Candidatus Criblamydia sequanensis CRIB-18 TaxID=1437425 RepID=A0A090D286_9BACT|nr:glycosyltransferase family 39 protein [Criblamydia sequanensis]CDR34425.1 Conserved putative membrane protein [Criblamydia sequanensis CRIB-18]